MGSVCSEPGPHDRHCARGVRLGGNITLARNHITQLLHVWYTALGGLSVPQSVTSCTHALHQHHPSIHNPTLLAPVAVPFCTAHARPLHSHLRALTAGSDGVVVQAQGRKSLLNTHEHQVR